MNTPATPTNLSEIEYKIFYRPADNPLETFYLPTLAASVQYDRSAGFFRSSALAAAAAGIIRLIRNNGRMRLLVGAELGEEDVEAIRRGYELREVIGRAMLPKLELDFDQQLAQRLDALTWMVANGQLDIKVVLPLDAGGYPIPGDAARDYHHTKKGIFTDAAGNQVAFIGSVNESAQGWQGNFEEFAVYASWEGQRDRSALAQLRISFNELWENRTPGWVAVDLPEAVHRELIRRAPSHPPDFDAPEPAPATVLVEGKKPLAGDASWADRVRFQFLRDAPYLLGAAGLGAATSAITFWPHQRQVADAFLRRYPDRVMLCDEVGLGKTIEAGLIMRQLILSGRVRRCLVLAPAAVLKQWQEELYEKFNLRFLRYHQRLLFDIDDQPIGPPMDNPWNDHPLLLASSHLAKRRDRVPQLAGAELWDLLVVDEAHHARRKDFLQPQYRPNRLLTLLNRLKETRRYQGLILLTATPMQVHPVEVWDLLTVLGLGGRWGADERNFLDFFGELRKPVADADWDFVFDLVQDNLAHSNGDAPVDGQFYAAMVSAVGAAHANLIRDLPGQPRPRAQTVRQLPPAVQNYVREFARRHTPLRRYVARNTRNLLRKYVAQGIVKENVPRRKPTIERIGFQPEEEALYARVTEYISDFYRKYEAERKGLGFIMTVYRRRLTSSFYAARRSLERRRDWLRGQLSDAEAFTIEDTADLDELEELEQEGLDIFGADSTVELTPGQKAYFLEELDYLDGFILDLQALSRSDSKTNQLIDDLGRIFRQRSKVMIFTQYTDTMDYLREQLQEVYRGAIACYSGRGGEEWNGIKWIETSKEAVKQQFKSGAIKILLCTESASEGLNLQTCGVLINYDMPWNPMRAEQRIGRIDRIGQEYDYVWISNYFYRDTIEDRIYQALSDRIHWFEDVVGALQPILSDVNDVTRRLAMLPAEEQEAEFQREIRRLRDAVDQARLEALDIDDYVATDQHQVRLNSPVSLADLEQVLTQSAATAHRFEPHAEIAHAFWLDWHGNKIAVTFNATCFDRHPSTVQFLSYGNPLLDELLASVPAPEAVGPALARFERSTPLPFRGWYDLTQTRPTSIVSLAALNTRLNQVASPADGSLDEAEHIFAALVDAEIREHHQRLSRLLDEERRARCAPKPVACWNRPPSWKLPWGSNRDSLTMQAIQPVFRRRPSPICNGTKVPGVGCWWLAATRCQSHHPLIPTGRKLVTPIAASSRRPLPG
jgi:superfamily II DNA or RNA helicase